MSSGEMTQGWTVWCQGCTVWCQGCTHWDQVSGTKKSATFDFEESGWRKICGKWYCRNCAGKTKVEIETYTNPANRDSGGC